MDDIMVKIFGWDYQLSLAYFGSMALFGLFCYAIGRQDGAKKERWKTRKIDFFDQQIGGGYSRPIKAKDVLLYVAIVFLLGPLLAMLWGLLRRGAK